MLGLLKISKMNKLLLFIGFLLASISISAQAVNENPYPLIECEDDTDGFAYFNLHHADADITSGNTSLFITYHLNIPDAEMGINALISPHMNLIAYNDLVYARVGNDQGAPTIVELELVVVSNLTIHPNDLTQIDDDEDGFAIFDLTENNSIVLAGLNPIIYSVSYFVTAENAENDEFPIAEPTAYQNIQNPQTIYVRVSNINESCVGLSSFIISTESLSIDTLGFENLNFFPNPSNESITLHSPQLNSETTISMYDILGKMVFSEKILPHNGSITLNISSLQNGIYFVKISYLPIDTTFKENVTVRKLIKF